MVACSSFFINCLFYFKHSLEHYKTYSKILCLQAVEKNSRHALKHFLKVVETVQTVVEEARPDLQLSLANRLVFALNLKLLLVCFHDKLLTIN